MDLSGGQKNVTKSLLGPQVGLNERKVASFRDTDPQLSLELSRMRKSRRLELRTYVLDSRTPLAISQPLRVSGRSYTRWKANDVTYTLVWCTCRLEQAFWVPRRRKVAKKWDERGPEQLLLGSSSLHSRAPPIIVTPVAPPPQYPPDDC